jgi:hypothetical protein
MLTLPPEIRDDLANPAFKDAASCSKWLAQLQLTNLHQVHGVLRAQLDELNRFRLPGQERLQIMELLRETVSFVQADYAKKLIAKKLPLSPDELTIFVSIVNLWQEMINGYLHCLHDYVAGNIQLASSGALLCQRSMTYNGLQIFEHLRTGYEFNNRLWKQLHSLYSFSEEQNLHLIECRDELHGSLAITCQSAYIKTLLACHARPAELTRRQLQLMDNWLTKWGSIVTMSDQCNVNMGEAAPLAVDLGGSQGLQSLNQAAPSSSLRYLSLIPLSKLLRVKEILLQQGQSPEQLELGEGCNNGDCVELLKFLHQCWCEDRDDRKAERHNAMLQAQASYGIEAIYAQISNKPFKRPGRKAGIDTVSRRQIETFGRVLPDTGRQNLASLGYELENWYIENFSILGTRLLREGTKGERLGLQQLVAVRPGNYKAFTLGKIRWSLVTGTGQLQVGIHYLPGVPQAIVLNVIGINLALQDKSFAALLLPAVPEMKTPASLIIPRNLFQPERMVEIILPDKSKMNVKMKLSIERGLDYERASFAAA